MKSLFILQLVCCVITAMLALQLAMASLQVRWKVWRYEISRWILVASLQELMGIITRYRSELNLLFFSTQHSRLKDYLEEWIEKSATIGMEYMEKMRRLHPELHTDISPFFMHFTCSWWINMMKEVVQHKELSCEEIECFISEYIRFSTGGWKKLMNVKNER